MGEGRACQAVIVPGRSTNQMELFDCIMSRDKRPPVELTQNFFTLNQKHRKSGFAAIWCLISQI